MWYKIASIGTWKRGSEIEVNPFNPSSGLFDPSTSVYAIEYRAQKNSICRTPATDYKLIAARREDRW